MSSPGEKIAWSTGTSLAARPQLSPIRRQHGVDGGILKLAVEQIGLAKGAFVDKTRALRYGNGAGVLGVGTYLDAIQALLVCRRAARVEHTCGAQAWLTFFSPA